MEPIQLIDGSIKPLTKEEAINIIKTWVAGDEEVDISDRRTVSEMVADLEDVDSYRTEQGLVPSGIEDFRVLVNIYAPNAPNAPEAPTSATIPTESKPTHELHGQIYPAELSPLITSGDVVFDRAFEHWVIRRCSVCGQFNRDECCGDRTNWVSAALHDNVSLTSYGKQALGLKPIVKPEPPKPAEQVWKESIWWDQFRSVEELQGDGSINWVVQNMLPSGVTVLTGPPKEGKSFVALSLAKAITSGQNWLNRVGFEVNESMPVLWLAAESGDSGLKIRCQKFKITKDKSRFICRTLTQGIPSLGDIELERLIRAMKPYVVLETLVRFGDGEDEDDAKEANQLARAIFRLQEWGAKGVLALHHSRKDVKRGDVTLEKAVRGSGDFAAMADCIWTLIRDEKVYKGGVGPNEIVISGWGRDFSPFPVRLALSRKATPGETTVQFNPGLVSILDQTGDLGWCVKAVEAVASISDEDLVAIVKSEPNITIRDLAARSGLDFSVVRRRLTKLGWTKARGPGKPWKAGPGS